MTLLRRGDAAAGAPAGATFTDLNEITATTSGRVLLIGRLTGGGVASTNDGVFYRLDGASQTLLAREGVQADGQPAGVQWSSFTQPVMALDGSVGFIGKLKNGGITSTSDDGVWQIRSGVTSVVMLEGEPAEDLPSREYGVPGVITINSQGLLALGATIRTEGGVTTANDTALWRQPTPGSTIDLMAREGDALPGLAETYSSFADVDTAASLRATTGGVYFVGTVLGAAATTDQGLLTGGTFIVRENQQVPGMPVGSLLAGTPQRLTTSLDGHIAFAFSGTNVAGQVTSANNSGICVGTPGNFTLAVREGTQIPGAIAGQLMNDATNYVPRVNDAGAVVFEASILGGGVTTATNSALLTTVGGVLQTIARKGDTPPSMPGTTIGDFTSWAINNAGQVLISITLTNAVGGVNANNNQAFLFWDPSLPAGVRLRYVAREGDLIRVASGQSATLAAGCFENDGTGLAYNPSSGAGDGRQASLTEDGVVVYAADFTDGSFRLLRVEPGSLACNSADLTDNSGTGKPDGALTGSDVVKFFSSFFAGCGPGVPCATADITDGSGSGFADGQLTGSDVVAFFTNLFAGCPGI